MNESTFTAPVSFGQMLRATRLGYGWMGTCFLRISGDGPFRCDVHPAGLIPNSMKCPHRLHRVWWGDGRQDRAEIVQLLPVARAKAKRPFTIYVNDKGEAV